MKRPKIGVLPLYDSERCSLWMLPHYMQGILEAGGLPMMLPLTDDEEQLQAYAGQLDGFLLTGGQDVHPNRYEESRWQWCGETSELRDAQDLYIIRLALQRDLPILGICRGLQILNVALGGSLYQDIQREHPQELKILHQQTQEYDKPVHSITVDRNTPLFDLFQKEQMRVNSIHHQAIKRLSPQLRPAAVAKDGIVEAAYMPDAAFVMGVQWHPEYLWKTDGDSQNLFRAFVSACAEDKSWRKFQRDMRTIEIEDHAASLPKTKPHRPTNLSA